jgi:hypothetical protein
MQFSRRGGLNTSFLSLNAHLLKNSVVEGSELDGVEVDFLSRHEGEKLSEFLYLHWSDGSRRRGFDLLMEMASAGLVFVYLWREEPIFKGVLILLYSRIKRYFALVVLFFRGILSYLCCELVNIASN